MLDQKVREVQEQIRRIAAQRGFKIKEGEESKDIFVYLERDNGVQEVGIPIRILKDKDKGRVCANLTGRLYINKIKTDFTIENGVKDKPENVSILSFEEMKKYLSERRSFFHQADIFILPEEFAAFDSLIKKLLKFFSDKGIKEPIRLEK